MYLEGGGNENIGQLNDLRKHHTSYLRCLFSFSSLCGVTVSDASYHNSTVTLAAPCSLISVQRYRHQMTGAPFVTTIHGVYISP